MTISRTLITAAAVISAFFIFTSCGKSEAPVDSATPQTTASSAAPAAPAAPAPPEGPVAQAPQGPPGIVVEVDGTQFTETNLEQDYQKMYAILKQNLPEDKFKEEAPKIKARIVKDFVIVTVLNNEMKKRGIKASEKEIDAEINRLKSTLKPGTTLEEQLKKNQTTYEQLRKETTFGIKVGKLVKQYGGAKLKPKDKDIKAFYNKNKEKFNLPERVHARHILIAVAKTDNDTAKAEKKAKAEDVRAKLAGGADFAQLANLYSDCPSKRNGGDLGTFPRGQMVKPFEDAAFSQKVKETGPVIQTDFGYHIVQVLEKIAPGVKPLDAESKKMIAGYLERQNQINAYKSLIEDLTKKAKIAVYKQY